MNLTRASVAIVPKHKAKPNYGYLRQPPRRPQLLRGRVRYVHKSLLGIEDTRKEHCFGFEKFHEKPARKIAQTRNGDLANVTTLGHGLVPRYAV